MHLYFSCRSNELKYFESLERAVISPLNVVVLYATTNRLSACCQGRSLLLNLH